VSTLPPDSDIIDIGKTAGTGIGGVVAGIAVKMWHSRKDVSGRLKRVEGKLDEMQEDRARIGQDLINHREEIWKAINTINASVARMDAKLDQTAETLQFIRGRLNGKADHG